MATLTTTKSPLKAAPAARHGIAVPSGLIGALPAVRRVAAWGAAPRFVGRGRSSVPKASAPHHGPVASSYAALDDADDTELHGSNQVALLALVPIGLMGIKWAISTGPLSLVVPAVLLALPVVGGGLRQLLAEGVSMAVRCTMWMQHHQAPREAAADPHHGHHAHHAHHTAAQPHHGRTHHSHSHTATHAHFHAHPDQQQQGRGNGAPMRCSPGALPPSAAPWPQQPQAAAAYPHHLAPTAPPSGGVPPQLLQRQPVGAWGDVTVPLPASRPSAGPPAQQLHHPAAWAPGLQRGASPGRQLPPPPGAVQHAAAAPTSRPATLAPPTPLQSLSDVQQCEDLDWEVSPQRQHEQHQANCPGGGAGGGGVPQQTAHPHHPVATAAAVADARRGHLQHPRHQGAVLQAPQPHLHPHAVQGPGFVPRHPPRGSAA